MSYETVVINTNGEGFYSITSEIQKSIHASNAQVVHLFVPHTSCALVISEDYDPTARQDMESFLQHLAPRNLSFITHTLEGPDDSPSHMKSILLQTSLTLFIEKGEILLGQWQGIFLAEFRDSPKKRKILLKCS